MSSYKRKLFDFYHIHEVVGKFIEHPDLPPHFKKILEDGLASELYISKIPYHSEADPALRFKGLDFVVGDQALSDERMIFMQLPIRWDEAKTFRAFVHETAHYSLDLFLEENLLKLGEKLPKK